MGDKKIEELETVKLEHCEDCMAHYPVGYNHTCPPWMKALVQFNKDIKNNKLNKKEVNIK